MVLGSAPPGARVHPCLERRGDVGAVLDELGGRGVLQLLVEGGATVAHDVHVAGLVDRYVVYLAPAVFGGDDALGAVQGPGRAVDRRPATGSVRLRLPRRRRRALGSGDGQERRWLTGPCPPRRQRPAADGARPVPVPGVPRRG